MVWKVYFNVLDTLVPFYLRKLRILAFETCLYVRSKSALGAMIAIAPC